MRPAIVHLIGHPASGKYTVAKALVAAAADRGMHVVLMDNHATGNVILSVVDTKTAGVPAGMWGRVGEVREVVYRTIEDMSPPEWSFVFTNVLVAGDAADEAAIERLASVAAGRGSIYLPVRVSCDHETLVARVPDAGRGERHKWTDPDAVRSFISSVTLVDAAGHDPVDVDTTEVSPDRTAEAIVAAWSARGG
jgi:chloramphenicol 3-O-phosphotransferase